MTPSFIARRIAIRTAHKLWSRRLPLAGWSALLLALAVYQGAPGAMAAVGISSRVEVAGVQAGQDCADVLMEAIVSRRATVARAAYQCMGPSLTQAMNEDEFVTQLRSRPAAAGQRAARVGDYPTEEGGRIVYFAMKAAGSTVGYMVYLDNLGKVSKIE